MTDTHDPFLLGEVSANSANISFHQCKDTDHIENMHHTSINGAESFCEYNYSSDTFDHIPQCDGADTSSETSINDTINSYNSEEEAESTPVRTVLLPSAVQGPAGAPLRLEVDITGQARIPSCVPLCVVTNPRSGWNKAHNLRTFLRQTGPDIMILSEHWGRKRSFSEALKSEHYKVLESSRGIRGIPGKGRNGKPTISVTGGGVAILYTEKHFYIEEAGFEAPEDVEAVWAIMTPKSKESDAIKKILVGGIYIAPAHNINRQQLII